MFDMEFGHILVSSGFCGRYGALRTPQHRRFPTQIENIRDFGPPGGQSVFDVEFVHILVSGGSDLFCECLRVQHRCVTLCDVIEPPGRKSGFWARFRPHLNRESLNIGAPAGRRSVEGPILTPSRLESGGNPARKTGFQFGSTIA